MRKSVTHTKANTATMARMGRLIFIISASDFIARLREAAPGERCIVASGKGAQLPKVPEALSLSSTTRGRPVVLAGGSDARGLTYSLLELADRARHGMPREFPDRKSTPLH